jgi:hypothetical protein
MAYTIGSGTLAPGDVWRCFVRFNNGIDAGTQYITARPYQLEGASLGGELVVFDHSRKIENDGTFTYFVSVRNDGPAIVDFVLQGGGVV